MRKWTKFENSKITTLNEDIQIKINNKTNRIPFRNNDITFNKYQSNVGKRREYTNIKEAKIAFDYNYFNKKEKEKENKSFKLDSYKNKKFLKPLKSKG